MARSPILEIPPKVHIPRRSERQRVDSLMYLDLGSENGGFPINLTEDGMAFQGVRALRPNQEIIVTFKLEGIEEQVTAMAKVVWLSETRKAGAVEFIDLPDATRTLIRNWIEKQKEARQPSKTVAPKKMSKIEGVQWPPVKSKVPPANTSKEPSTSAAAIIAPVEPVSLPAPVEAQAVEAQAVEAQAVEAQPVVAPNIDSLVLPDPEENLPAHVSEGTHVPLQILQIRSQLVGAEPKRRGINSYAVSIAAGVAIMIGGGLVLWPLRGTLLHQSAKNAPAPATVQMETPAPEPFNPIPEDLPLAQAASITAVDLSPQLPGATEPQEISAIPAAPAAPVAPLKALAHPVTKAPPAPPPPVHANSTPARTVSAENPRTPQPVAQPAQGASISTPSPSPVAEATNEFAGGGKISAPQPIAPVIAALPTGSVEIVLDPYPSIRVPADSQKRLSKPGTTLQFGHLISRVEPVYPPDALRQRMGGTVKAHVLIGADGAVLSSEVTSGPSMLAEAALRAIRQWHFEPTLLGGTAIGVEEDITLVFRIAASPSPAN